MKGPIHKYPYSFEEFLEHLESPEISRTFDFAAYPSFKDRVLAVFAYMKGHYPNEDEAKFKLSRFSMIIQTIDTSSAAFRTAGLIDANGHSSTKLLRAAHFCITAFPLEELADISDMAKPIIDKAAEF